MSLQMKLKQIGDAYSESLGAIVFHYFRPKGMNTMLIWQEDSEVQPFNADNAKAEQTIHGTTDYYTPVEYDTIIDTIQGINDTLFGSGWSLLSVQYEEDTKLIHYEWEWRIAVYGEESDSGV